MAEPTRHDFMRVREHRRHLIASILRVVVVTTLLFVLYAEAPLDKELGGDAELKLVLALVAYLAIVTFQITSVARSTYPGLRALEAVAVSVPLLLFLFASIYLLIDHQSGSSFNEHLDHVDGVYFAVTVFATVGFGDIAAKSDAARIVVTIQMIVDLFFFGVVARVLFGTVQRRRQALSSGTGADSRGESATGDGDTRQAGWGADSSPGSGGGPF